MKDFERKLRRSKELLSNDFGNNLLRDIEPELENEGFRFDLSDFNYNKLFRKTKTILILVFFFVIYLIIASIIGTITILKAII
jgi:hypothetical protein